MATAFASEHSLCADHCNAVNSNTDVTSATYNVCAGYLTIWYYSNDNFDTKEYISRLIKLFYEGQLRLYVIKKKRNVLVVCMN